MKKLTALLLAMAMVLSLVACGAKEAAPATEPAAPAAEAPAAPAEEPAEEAPLTGKLVIQVGIAGNAKPVEFALKAFQGQNPGFEYEIITTDNIKTLLTTAAQAGAWNDFGDVFLLNDNVFQNYFNAYGEDMFHPIDNADLHSEDYAVSKIAFTSANGSHYAFPFDTATAVYAVRTDILEAAGFTLDDVTDVTWDEFLAVGKVVLEKTKMPLLSTQSPGSNLLCLMLNSANQGFFNDAGECVIADNAAIAEVFRVYKELRDTGVLVELSSWNEYTASFATETAAGTMEGAWVLGVVEGSAAPGTWGVTNLPKLNVDGATNYGNSGGSSWFVSGHSENYDLAVAFLDFFMTDPACIAYTMECGKLSSYTPAKDFAVMTEAVEYWGNAPVYSRILSYGPMSPTASYGIHYDTAKTAYVNAIFEAYSGSELADALKAAQETVDFAMEG